jgi:hypothetical protein
MLGQLRRKQLVHFSTNSDAELAGHVQLRGTRPVLEASPICHRTSGPAAVPLTSSTPLLMTKWWAGRAMRGSVNQTEQLVFGSSCHGDHRTRNDMRTQTEGEKDSKQQRDHCFCAAADGDHSWLDITHARKDPVISTSAAEHRPRIEMQNACPAQSSTRSCLSLEKKHMTLTSAFSHPSLGYRSTDLYKGEVRDAEWCVWGATVPTTSITVARGYCSNRVHMWKCI